MQASDERLWEFFFRTDFCLKTTEGDASDDWRGAYIYVSSVMKLKEPQWLSPPTSLFADDGGHIAGYPAQNALGHGPECWCTRPGVDRNVDLVAELQEPALVTAFRFANPEAGYTMPVRDALGFASFDVPDLTKARAFDNSTDDESSQVTRRREDEESEEDEEEEDLHGDVLNGLIPGAAGYRFDLEALARAARGSSDNVTAVAKCGAPTVANFVHFKLLSSYHPDGSTVNIDVRHLHTFQAAVDPGLSQPDVLDETSSTELDYRGAPPPRLQLRHRRNQRTTTRLRRHHHNSPRPPPSVPPYSADFGAVPERPLRPTSELTTPTSGLRPRPNPKTNPRQHRLFHRSPDTPSSTQCRRNR